MLYIVVAIILMLIALAAAGLAAIAPREDKPACITISGLVIVVLVLWTAAFSFTQVHAKEIGIKTNFGKTVGELNSGMHMKMPWQHVVKVDETIFTDTYAGDQALPVRLGDGNTATVAATIRWHVDPAAAQYIYQNYRSNNPSESLKDAVVDTQFKAAINEVLSGFNPTANAESLSFSPDYAQLAKDVTTSMNGRVKDAAGTSMVIIDGITVAGVQYSQATEDRINSIISQAAKTQQAIQAEKTAKAQAAANRILAQSVSKDPNVLVSKCLDALANGDIQNQPGFSCWPGSGSAVVVPSK